MSLAPQAMSDCAPVAADGRGNEMLLAKVEAWTHGGSSAASHLRLLCCLLQSSLAAQRQLFEDQSQAGRSVPSIWQAICNL
jgi:hypothetical protein